MAHPNPAGTDWVVAAFVTHPTQPRVLLCHHKQLDGWFPVGGHIELDAGGDADPDAALIREVREETGLQVWPNDGVVPPSGGAVEYDAYVVQTFAQDRRRDCRRRLGGPADHNARPHWVPWAVETHDFAPLPGHKHLALIYLVRAVNAAVTLEAAAHHALKWFSAEELGDPQYRLTASVLAYAYEALNA